MTKAGFVSIKGFEGIYAINKDGVVISQQRNVYRKNGVVALHLQKTLTSVDCGHGYLKLNLRINDKNKAVYIHRLIAEAFIPNPKLLPCVNHKNGIKKDNRIENLEWCTYTENNRHAFDIGLQKKGENHHLFGKKSGQCVNSKRIKNKITGQVFESYADAAKSFGISRAYFSAKLKKGLLPFKKLKNASRK